MLRGPGDRREPHGRSGVGCSPAPRSRCRPRATCPTSPSAPASTRVIGLTEQPPLEQHARRGRARGRRAPRARRRGAAGERRRGAARAAGGRAAVAARAARLAHDRPPAGRALGQEDGGLPDRRALRRDLDHGRAVRRARRPSSCCSSWGGFAVRLHPGRPRAALDRAMTATVAPAEQRPRSRPRRGLPRRRAARARARPRARPRLPVPRDARCCWPASARSSRWRRSPAATPSLGLAAARRRLAAADRGHHERAPADARASAGRCRRCCGSASTRRCSGWRRSADAAAGRVRADAALDVPPLRPRLPAAPPRRGPAALAEPRSPRGWDGRLILAWVLLALGALPGGDVHRGRRCSAPCSWPRPPLRGGASSAAGRRPANSTNEEDEAE